MTYKDSIKVYFNRLDEILTNSGAKVKSLTEEEVMFRLSKVQMNLNNTYDLYKGETTIELVQATTEYALATYIKDYKNIISIFYKGIEITPMSYEELKSIVSRSEITYNFSVYDKKLVLGFSPANSYSADNTEKLYINYCKRLETFDSAKGTVNSPSFSDWDKASAGYGGSWKIPEVFHMEIIEGALAEIFPNLLPQHLERVVLLAQKEGFYYSGQSNYFFGI
jgi:hypothetical protein